MKKIINVIGLIADIAPGACVVLVGLAVMAGGMSGVLWH